MSDFTNENSMSFSIYVDECPKGKIKSELSGIQKRKIHTWISNEAVSECYNCKTIFGFFTRKHHCRACGRIYCYYCCSNWTKIDISILEKIPSHDKRNTFLNSVFNKLTNPTNQQRVCEECSKRLQELETINNTLIVFSNSFDIVNIQTVKNVNKLWHKTSMYYLSMMREIQYKLPYKKFSQLENKLLYKNYIHFGKHNQWIYQLIMCSNMNNVDKILKIIKADKTVSCWKMMCTSSCKEELNKYQVSTIIRTKSEIPDSLMSYFITILDTINDKNLDCYFMMFTDRLCEEDSLDTKLLTDYVFNRSIKNKQLAFRFIVDLNTSELYEKNHTNRILIKRIKDNFLHTVKSKKNIMFMQLRNIIELTNIFKHLSKPTKKEIEPLNNYFIHKGPLYMPFKLDTKYSLIDINNIKVMHSYYKPVMIPFYRYDEEKDTAINKTDRILYKEEDLRQDYIIHKLIKLISNIIEEELQIDPGVIYYDILPLNDNKGLIEIVNESFTITNIFEKNFTIQNFIMENNLQNTIKELRNRFIRSTASYCIITYLLGIEDRHMDNIMIHRNGKLFHIDYGYILGHDPKLSKTYIRITPEMLDAMGGAKSDKYKEFCELSTTIYNVVRKYIPYISCMMLNLNKINPDVYTLDKIDMEIGKRFTPGVNRMEGKCYLTNLLDKSNSDGWGYYFSDMLHSTFQRVKLFSSGSR